jgi:hypothetical protein
MDRVCGIARRSNLLSRRVEESPHGCRDIGIGPAEDGAQAVLGGGEPEPIAVEDEARLIRELSGSP